LSLLVLAAGCKSNEADTTARAVSDPAPMRRVDASAAPASKASSVSAVAASPGAGARAGSQRPDRPLNVLLITIDALRADMPWAGYEREIAPNLTQLAAEGVVWEQHRSVASYTAQTVGTLLSGR
jgi:hypothetical protein